MKIVVLDSYCVHEGDLNWQPLYELTQDITLYPRTPQQQTAARIGDADYVIGNKCIVDEALLAQCPNLKWIGLTATGTDWVDLEACRRRGVAVANVPGYSTYSVAQHTFALLLEITNGTSRRAASLRDGYWQTEVPARYGIQPHQELHGMTFGIVGYGDIGRAAAKIAQGFGMEVLVYTRTLRPPGAGRPVCGLAAAAKTERCGKPALPSHPRNQRNGGCTGTGCHEAGGHSAEHRPRPAGG